jgi:hypothetical protein
VKIFDPRMYVGGGWYSKTYNYLGYPNVNGFGFGISKLPDLNHLASIYGNAWYFPSVTGKFKYPTNAALAAVSGQTYQVGYAVYKYKVGGTLTFGAFYVDAGYAGERFNMKTGQNAPSSATINAPYAGLGVHF